MTAAILPENQVQSLKPDFVAPVAAYLCSPECKETGLVFEAGSGWFAQVRVQRAQGLLLPTSSLSLENVASHWHQFKDYSKSVYPKDATDSFSSIIALTATGDVEMASADTEFTFTEKDVMLYNVGIGCTEKDLKYVYEGSKDFGVFPTFAVIPAFQSMMSVNMSKLVTDFNPAFLLHGEHSIELMRSFPTKGTLRVSNKVIQVLEKTSGSVVVLEQRIKDDSGHLLAISEGTIFLRKTKPIKTIDGNRTKFNQQSIIIPRDRVPDKSISQRIPSNQAAIFFA
jgi:multifunctional beta-oxidation protein